MQVSDPNNVKIYNLSAGKSLPEWLSERKRRAMLKKNIDIRRRIELIQDFDMPGVSTTVKVSKDGHYILATGIYKPRIKCFDVNNLSLKFERCFDSEAVTFDVLSDDYSKIVFLQCDRYIEFHAAHGRYNRLRIPKFGRDMKYHYATCDLFVVGASSDIYRINLERGQFMTPYESPAATAINKCEINPVHNLFVCGTQEGRIEAWDPRSKGIVGQLDCAFNCVNENNRLAGFPSITALKFNGSLQLGVGTATGQILLYDIRSNKPFFVKDHMYELPIKDIDFHYQQDLVYSMDSSVVKIWDKNNGKLFTSIEATNDFNNLCVYPNTGLFFIANETTKIQTYYIPSLGPAPKWSSFLDSLTEELEETNTEIVYDDYKFVTKQELDSFGLDHLIGTNLLRAYMHGYFMDMRLYKKAKSVANPFEFDEYRKKKIKETIDKDRVNRVQINKLPTVNKELALKLMNDETKKKKQSNVIDNNLLTDTRFKALFENSDFQVDKNTDEYRFLNPVLSKLDQTKQKNKKKTLVSDEFELVQDEELEGKNSSDESDYSSDDEDHQWTNEMKKQHSQIQREHRAKDRLEAEMDEKEDNDDAVTTYNNKKRPKMFELRSGSDFKGVNHYKQKMNKSTLGERLENEEISVRLLSSVGSREMTFSTARKRGADDRLMDRKNQRHREERKQLVRPTNKIIKSKHKNTNYRNKRRR